jgi:hypothetical protein
MGDGRPAHGELTEERLHIADLGGALGTGGGVAHVTDANGTRQRLHHRLRGEAVAHQAKAAGRVEALLRVMRDDAARLLPPMLQRVQPERHEARGIHHARDAENAALLAEFVIIIGIEWVAKRVG